MGKRARREEKRSDRAPIVEIKAEREGETERGRKREEEMKDQGQDEMGRGERGEGRGFSSPEEKREEGGSMEEKRNTEINDVMVWS